MRERKEKGKGLKKGERVAEKERGRKWEKVKGMNVYIT